ncbi:hypothetical protein A0J61_04224 [Choanephora cucurbitarum]|uniref:Uncharacterized protein n=1 Tax=Choanephora cucurbitarum TaxID=101091 RepID=A0A1C7NF45_9FUNG|nr:hypothetical protein A0J61_04224 [Choanephora cucurbitarum]
MMEVKEIFRLIGFLLVFLFPIAVIYLTGEHKKAPLLDDEEYEKRKRLQRQQQQQVESTKKNKKKNKKKQQAKVTVEEEEEEEEKVEEQQKPSKKQKKKNNKQEQAKSKPDTVKQESGPVAKETPIEEETKVPEEKIKEIDEHMDPTVNYARVMRIRPEEEEEEWEAVPYEEGWSQVKGRRQNNTAKSSPYDYVDNNAEVVETTSRYIPGLDKKQRENMARNAKKKQQKAAADALQAERLRKHQKELEKAKIEEFYSKGKGKNTQWGKNGQRTSSKVPNSYASFNEFGQLIWE